MTHPPEPPTTPHAALAAWGTAVAIARVAWVTFHAAEATHNKAAAAYCRYTGPTDAVEAGLFKAIGAADTAEEATYAVYDDAAEVAVVARAAVCAAYDHAGFPQAFRALETIAPRWGDWAPDLEATLAALLAEPVRA